MEKTMEVDKEIDKLGLLAEGGLLPDAPGVLNDHCCDGLWKLYLHGYLEISKSGICHVCYYKENLVSPGAPLVETRDMIMVHCPFCGSKL